MATADVQRLPEPSAWDAMSERFRVRGGSPYMPSGCAVQWRRALHVMDAGTGCQRQRDIRRRQSVDRREPAIAIESRAAKSRRALWAAVMRRDLRPPEPFALSAA